MSEMIVTEHTEYTVSVPAGEYYLCDPCYVVPSDQWMHLLESCDYFRKPVGTLPDGTEVLAFSTKYGDGCYEDQYGNEFPVDAGLIGLTPVASAKPDGGDGGNNLRVTFDAPVHCTSRNGVLTFGKFRINTDD